MRRRVVITGIGMITPLGNSAPATWAAAKAGQSGIGPITRFDASRLTTRFAGEVRGFEAGLVMDHRELRRYDVFIHYALGAAAEALVDSGLIKEVGEAIDPALSERAGAIYGSGMGGMDTVIDTAALLAAKGPGRVSPFFTPGCIINMPAGLMSIRWGLKGPNYATVSACASSGHAIADSFHVIQRDEADIMITGGSEAVITELAVAAFANARALSTRNDDPPGASRPFDAQRDGFVMAEGGATLILEELEHARARGAQIYAEIIGAGMSGDAYHITAPAPGGDGAARAMNGALKSAGLAPAAVGHINAHATATDLGDIGETLAIKAVFGDGSYRLGISATKSMTGHLLGAAAAVEAAFTAMCLQDQIFLPTINLNEPDPQCDLDYVPHTARPAQFDVALSNSFGFGGTNISLVLRRYSASEPPA